MKLEFCASCGSKDGLSQWRPNIRLDSITLCESCLSKASIAKDPRASESALAKVRELLRDAGTTRSPMPSYAALATGLRVAGLLTPTGKAWTEATVYRLCQDTHLDRDEIFAQGILAATNQQQQPTAAPAVPSGPISFTAAGFEPTSPTPPLIPAKPADDPAHPQIPAPFAETILLESVDE